jgi:hypothetical protein
MLATPHKPHKPVGGTVRFVKLLLDQAEQQAKLRESDKKDEAAN